jgi:hypothetical protein
MWFRRQSRTQSSRFRRPRTKSSGASRRHVLAALSRLTQRSRNAQAMSMTGDRQGKPIPLVLRSRRETVTSTSSAPVPHRWPCQMPIAAAFRTQPSARYMPMKHAAVGVGTPARRRGEGVAWYGRSGCPDVVDVERLCWSRRVRGDSVVRWNESLGPSPPSARDVKLSPRLVDILRAVSVSVASSAAQTTTNTVPSSELTALLKSVKMRSEREEVVHHDVSRATAGAAWRVTLCRHMVGARIPGNALSGPPDRFSDWRSRTRVRRSYRVQASLAGRGA